MTLVAITMGTEAADPRVLLPLPKGRGDRRWSSSRMAWLGRSLPKRGLARCIGRPAVIALMAGAVLPDLDVLMAAVKRQRPSGRRP